MHGWRPWLKAELEKRSFSVSIPAMPKSLNPVQSEWVQTIKGLVGKSGDDCILIGHSLGVVAILRYLEVADKKVAGALLVAGPVEYNGLKEIENFFSKGFNWEEIRKNCEKFVVIISDNDRYVPIRHGEIYRKNLAAKVMLLPGRGHFSSDEGCTSLPEALDAIISLTS